MALTVVSNVVKVLKEVMVRVQTLVPDVKIVYDGDLAYESAVEKLRAKNNQNLSSPTIPSHSFFPLLVFNRSPLRVADILIGERGAKMTTKLKISDTAYKMFRSAQGRMDLQFTYYVNSLEQGEQFEILYLSENGISGIEDVTVNVGTDLGDHHYSLDWKDLDEFTLNNSNAYYASYSGTIELYGWWFIEDSAQQAVIQHINATISGSNSELIDTIII